MPPLLQLLDYQLVRLRTAAVYATLSLGEYALAIG